MTHGNLNCKNIIVNEADNLELSNYGNLNQLCMAHAVWNDDGNLSLYFLEKMDSLTTEKGNDILGIGFTVYEIVTGEIVSS
jgi:hypothetical protein